jgi:hypothetical protein
VSGVSTPLQAGQCVTTAANAWLTSSAFDLKEPRSLEAEKALLEALKLLRDSNPATDDVERVNDLLRTALSDVDRFWVRWTAYRKSLEAV